MALTPGTRLGPYDVLSSLGAGGMGEVYKARDTRLQRDVAVKVLPADFARDGDRLARLEQEARAAAALNHPNIVAVYDIGTHQGAPFVVMELLEGASLRERLASGPLPARKATDYGVQLATGLAAAHARGIVHRDLKPENVFVTHDGRVKVLDFGLAKVVTALPADATLATGAVQTAAGLVMGTVGYMAPEQVRGQAADHRADIFACGTILYEMFAGKRAFSGESAVETMNAILTQDAPELPSDVSRPIPPALDRIVRRCMEKLPDDRFQSARDLAFALEAISSASGAVALPGVRQRRGSAVLRYGAVAAAVLAVAAAAWVLKPSGPPLPPQATYTQLTFDTGIEAFPSLSPDGKWMVYSGGPTAGQDIFLIGVGAHNAINLTADSPSSDDQPAFSPDGELIAFRSERDGGGIFVMGRTGDSVRRVADGGFNPAWSPDGRFIVTASEGILDPTARFSNGLLSIVELATGQRRPLTGPEVDAVQPHWSPDGKWIAYWSARTTGGRRDLWTIAAGGGEPVRVTDDAAVDWNPVWAADGSGLYFLSDRGGSMGVWFVPVDGGTGAPAGPPQPFPVPAASIAHLSVAAGGTRLAYASIEHRQPIVKLTLDAAGRTTGAPVVVTGGSRMWFGADPSLDGRLLALGSFGQQEDIFVARADGSGMRQVTNDPAKDRYPTWSPDGRQLAFYSNRSGTYHAWIINADGSGLKQITPPGDSNWIYPRWSPDGRRIALATVAGDAGVVDVSSPAQTIERLSPLDGGFYPWSWSPDGRYLAGLRARGVNPDSFVYSFETRRYELLTREGGYPVWFDSERLIVTTGDRRLRGVSRTTGEHTDLGGFGADVAGPLHRVVGGATYLSLGHREADLWLAEIQKK